MVISWRGLAIWRCKLLDTRKTITKLSFLTFFSTVWDLEAGKREVDFEAHEGDVVTMSLAPDGNTFVTGSVDKSCKLWDLRATQPKQTFWGHGADVNSVCVSDNQKSFSRNTRPIQGFIPAVPSEWICVCYWVRGQDRAPLWHSQWSADRTLRAPKQAKRIHILRWVVCPHSKKLI